MSTRGVADVVFCLDASLSMKPCIDAVRSSIQEFVSAVTSGNYSSWDLRLDFLAHAADESSGLHTMETVHASGIEIVAGLYRGVQTRFFTSSIDEFRNALGRITVSGDEMALLALDTVLDFPWREERTCHRVVVFLTDEPMETGIEVERQRQLLDTVVRKIADLRVLLFMVAPESEGFDALAAADKCIYEVVGESNSGLSSVDFSKVLTQIGKSLSVSPRNQSPLGERAGKQRGLFGQADFGVRNRAPLRGA